MMLCVFYEVVEVVVFLLFQLVLMMMLVTEVRLSNSIQIEESVD